MEGIKVNSKWMFCVFHIYRPNMSLTMISSPKIFLKCQWNVHFFSGPITRVGEGAGNDFLLLQLHPLQKKISLRPTEFSFSYTTTVRHMSTFNFLWSRTSSSRSVWMGKWPSLLDNLVIWASSQKSDKPNEYLVGLSTLAFV